MPDYAITPQLIYEHTTGGLDVFDRLCPGAAKAYENNKHFKIRQENTSSAHLKEYDGVFYIKDFGDTKKGMNCIEFVMDEESLTFYEAVKYIANEFNIPTNNTDQSTSSYEYKRETCENEEKQGEIEFQSKDWDQKSLQSVFARNIWEDLKRKNRKRLEDKSWEPASDEVAFRNAIELCKQYGFINLEWYSLVARDKITNDLIKHKYFATQQYPINMWEAGKWRKIYKPKERNKKYRFLIQGEKTRVMFGLSECQKALDKLMEKELDTDNDDPQEDEAPEKKEKVKLDQIIICSGGSDAINVAAAGYNVVWFDNEMFQLTSSEWSKLSGMAHRVYYLGDIDESGIKAAVELGKNYLDLELIFLPQYLTKYYDQRGNSCKDVRDFFKYHSIKDFDSVVNQSMPIRFWMAQPKRTKGDKLVKYKGQIQYAYKPNEELILNFLHHEGFARYEIPSDKRGYTIVKTDDNVIKRDVAWEDVYQHVKSFLKSPSVMGLVKGSYLDLVNAFNRSPAFNRPILENLKKVEFDFESSGRNYQYLFFSNATWKVFADKVEVIKASNTKVKVWEDKVVPHKAKLTTPPFTITKDPKSGQYDIEIHENDNVYLNFLVQTSRIHWRKELEDELDKLGPDEKKKYLEDNKFNIAGPLLTAQEQYEQKQVLISKLCAFGYLLHEFKDRSKAYAVWCTDHSSEQFTEELQSFGGTGKSIGFDTLSHYLDLFIIPGRDQKKVESEFVFHGVTKHTRVLYTDDAGEFFKFELWYTLITGAFPVNPKFGAPYTIPFKEAPKLAFTSNFPPRKNDGSTRRRLWFTTNSSYYHKNTNGEFREDREPYDDFGIELFGDQFSEDQWNKTHNVMACCLQGWLKFGKVKSVEETIYQNILLSKMTHNFKSWADEAFHPDNNRLDAWVQRDTLYELWKRYNKYSGSPQLFLDRLKCWVEYNEYTYNPKALLGDKKRMMKHVELESIDKDGQVVKIIDHTKTDPSGAPVIKKGTKEVIFIQTKPFEESQEADQDSKGSLPF